MMDLLTGIVGNRVHSAQEVDILGSDGGQVGREAGEFRLSLSGSITCRTTGNRKVGKGLGREDRGGGSLALLAGGGSGERGHEAGQEKRVPHFD